MNELQERILALLVAKFQGVRKDGLQHLAAAIGLQVTTEEEANQVVDKLTADKVSAFVTETRRLARLTKPTKTALKKSMISWRKESRHLRPDSRHHPKEQAER